ncbi:MAG: hypothetical protein ABL902_02830 [Gallionella sp.]
MIGNDGGLFATKKTLGPDSYLVLVPGERVDLILDLTGVCPHEVSKLRLVGSLARGEWPEAIFQHENTDGSILKSIAAPDNIFQTTLLAIMQVQANIMQFCIVHNETDGHDHAHVHDHSNGKCNC